MSSTKKRKKEKDFIDSAIRAASTDEDLSGFLNLAVCQSEDDPEKVLVVVTTKMLYYHEPAKHIPRLRLVLLGDGGYYIQVMLLISANHTNRNNYACTLYTKYIPISICSALTVTKKMTSKRQLKTPISA